MNLFIILFLIIAPSFAGSPPACKELGKILENYELSLSRDSIKSCSPETYKKLLPTNVDLVNKEFLKEKACSNLNAVEAELSQLKIELAVLDGIHKLVSTVKSSKEGVENSTPEISRVNGQTFVSSLNTAQSLEVLLYTNTISEKPFIQELAEVSKNTLVTEEDLKNRVSELCAKKPKNLVDACNPKIFKPQKEAVQEILGLIKNGAPKDKDITKWQNQLAIERVVPSEDDNDYTFTQMQSEMQSALGKIDNKEFLSKSELDAIKKLDNFKFPQKMSFVEELSLLTDQKKKKIASNQFLLLMGDAQSRQQYEVQSKLSIHWDEIKQSATKLSESDKSHCEKAKSNYDSATLCVKSLANDPGILAKKDYTLTNLLTSINYIDLLDTKSGYCKEELASKETISEKCYAGFAEFNKDRAGIQDKILQLNLVKEKIGSQNVTDMKFRNLALQKWSDQKCQYIESSMDRCSDTSVFTPSAYLTVSDSMKIAILFSSNEDEKSDAMNKAEEVCEDETREGAKRVEERLCEFFNETSPEVVKGPTKDADDDEAQLEVENNYNKSFVRDAIIGNGVSTLYNLAGAFAPTNYAPSYGGNPYPYNYTPYNQTGTPPMGISESILFNARYQRGYGFYMPTPGYQPYTAFGYNPASTAYKPLVSPSTRYFNY